MALVIPGIVLSYPFQGDDSNALLHFREGWTVSAVIVDGRHSTLRQIASIHTEVVSEAGERRQKLDAS